MVINLLGLTICWPQNQISLSTLVGNFFGYARVEQGGVNLYYKWDDPFGGYCCDEMRLHGKDEMHVMTHLTVGTDNYSYRVIYWREGTMGSGEVLQPTLSTLLRRTASKMALQMQGALGMMDSKAVAQHTLSQGGRRRSSVDGLDGHSSDSSGNHDRRQHDSYNLEGGKSRRLRPFARVEEL